MEENPSFEVPGIKPTYDYGNLEGPERPTLGNKCHNCTSRTVMAVRGWGRMLCQKAKNNRGKVTEKNM
jgi:hypothetical protein